MRTDGKMSFKEYVFEQNPSMMTIAYNRNIVSRVMPNSKSDVQELGLKRRIISGEGTFFGEQCVEQSERLRTVFEQGGKGILYLPGQKPMVALFRSLEIRAVDMENVMEYRFVFDECESDATEPKLRMALGDGKQCLWDFAYRYGVDIDDLMEWNDDILRPDEVIPCGKEVRLC